MKAIIIFIIIFGMLGCLIVFQEKIFSEVAQNLGFPDALYTDLLEADCRSCHGPAYDVRHHQSAAGQSGVCVTCHADAGGQLTTETDCLACHAQAGSYSPHHVTQDALDGLCAECHQANLVTDIQFAPSSSPPPYPDTCQTCHDVPSNIATHHGSVAISCTQCHNSHNMSSFRRCMYCHSELSLHNIAPHRDSCTGCHVGESPPPVASEAVMPAIHAIDPIAEQSGETLAITGVDFGAAGPDSAVTFDSTAATVTQWDDTAITVVIPDLAFGNYDIRVANTLGTSNKTAFSLSADSPNNPIYDQVDCSMCHSTEHGFQSPDYRACAGCHVLHQDFASVHDMTRLDDPSCAACHDENVEIEHTENRGIPCGTCHDSTDPGIQDAITRGMAGEEIFCYDCHTGSGNHYCAHQVENNDCTACHLRNLQPEHDDNCDLCHQSTDPAVIQAITDGSTTCTACHTVDVHSMNCALCHNDQNWDDYIGEGPRIHKKHMDKVTCGVCHMIPTAPVLEPTGQYCTTCHNAEPYGNDDDVRKAHKKHVKETSAAPYQCTTCHGRSIPDHLSTECQLCHSDETYPDDWSQNRHADHAVRFECTACHQQPGDFDFSSGNFCLRCHNIHGGRLVTSGDEQEWVGFRKGFSGESGNPMTRGAGWGAHESHKGKTQCWGCHGNEDVAAQTAGFQCTSCHENNPSMNDVQGIHKEHAGDVYQCWVCHDTLVPVYSVDQVNEPTDCP